MKVREVMPVPHGPLFVLADGAHARFVVRKAGTRSFTTIKELDGSRRLKALRRELRASPPPRSQESSSPTRHGMGREDYFRQAKETFIADVAKQVLTLEDEARDGVVIVAPARLVGPLRDRLEGRTRVVGVLRKDLIKTPSRNWPGGWRPSPRHLTLPDLPAAVDLPAAGVEVDQ